MDKLTFEDEKEIINLMIQMLGALLKMMIINVLDPRCSIIQTQQFIFSYIELGKAIIGASYKTLKD